MTSLLRSTKYALLVLLTSLVAHAEFKALLTLPENANHIAHLQFSQIQQSPLITKDEGIFTAQEIKLLQKNNMQHLSTTRKLSFASEEQFLELKALIQKNNYQVHLDPAELELKAQNTALELKAQNTALELKAQTTTELKAQATQHENSEPFYHLQWALNNDGAAQSVDLDQLRSFRVPGLQGQDVGMTHGLTNKLGRKVRIAVLDTGIDKNHPDLKPVIMQNETECRALEKFLACSKENDRKACEKTWFDISHPEVDLDQNGYPLDCSGWSTLGGVNAAQIMGRPDFSDNQGHGTHVAGIIAAQKNGQGVLGASQNVELIPIQVIGNAPNEPIKPQSFNTDPKESSIRRPARSLADFVARGILYAINAKADVINLSLGWPQATDSEFMRQVISEAINRGIIVVAAAGNDSTKALLRPCAYEGVICVGAHGPDGAFSHFSNFGSGVDVLAPGTNVLSTYPIEKRPIRFRLRTGYEFLHGTSQASPYVAAAAAELLAQAVPTHEVRARLLLGSTPTTEPLGMSVGQPHEKQKQAAWSEKFNSGKYSLSGNLNISRALMVSPQALIVPTQKESREILWDRQSSIIEFPLTLKNIWQGLPQEQVQIRVRMAKPHSFSVRPEVFEVTEIAKNSENKTPTSIQQNQWQANQTREFLIKTRITDVNNPLHSRISSDIELNVEVQIQEKLYSFYVPYEIVVPLHPDINQPGIHILATPPLPRGRSSFLALEETLDGKSNLVDYLVATYEQKKWSYKLLSQHQPMGKYFEIGEFSLTAPEKPDNTREQILSRIDINNDGLSEYVIGLYQDNSRSNDNTPSEMNVYVLSNEMQKVSSYQIKEDFVQIPHRVRWMSLNGQKVPAWLGYGKNPDKKATLVDLWQDPDLYEDPEQRFYYLNHQGQYRALQKHAGYEIIDVLEPTAQHLAQGEIPVLMEKNRGNTIKPSYMYDFAIAIICEGKIQSLTPIDLLQGATGYRNFLDTRVDTLISLSPEESPSIGTFWFAEGRDKSQRLSYLVTDEKLYRDVELFPLKKTTDASLWVRAVFHGNNSASAFVLTNSEIQFHDLISGETTMRSLERYTYFSDTMVTNFHFPITIAQNEHGAIAQNEHNMAHAQDKLPALFLTENSELSRSLKIVTPAYNLSRQLVELVVPARLRFKSDRGCKALENPIYETTQGNTYVDYFCQNKILRVELAY